MAIVHGPDCNPVSPLSDQLFDVFNLREKSSKSRSAGIALALGGGFCRGFAHLGVLEVLDQERIPIAGIAGASMGALLGAAYADGISIQELCRFGRRVRIRDFVQLRASHGVMETNGGIGQFVRDWFRASRLEELPIPTAIVATNLDTGAPYIFASGPLDVAIRASCAFPGLFEPVQHQGCTLADGCIAAPVPTEAAARMTASCVLGVAVFANGNGTASSSDTGRIVGGDRSGRRTRSSSWAKPADILLEPDVRRLAWNDFTRVDDARAAGAQAMRRALPGLRELLARRSLQQYAPSTFS